LDVKGVSEKFHEGIFFPLYLEKPRIVKMMKKVLIVVICAYILKDTESNVVKVKEVQDRVGALIIADQPIAFTSLTWRLVFEWDLSPLKKTLQQINYIHQNLTRNVTDATEKRAIVHVAEALATAETEFNNFLDLIAGGKRDADIRKKRDLKNPKDEIIDVWKGTTGSLAASLFGIATTEEMDAVHGFLDSLFQRESKIITIQKLHVTTLKKIQSQIDIQQQQLDRTVNVTYNLYKAMMKKMQARTDVSVANLLVHNDLVNAITMFKMTIVSHRQILASLDRGYISPDLISVKELQDTLIQVNDKIPSGFKLIYDPLKEDLNPYYNLKLAKRLVGSENLRGVMQVPLTGLTDDFMLYKSIPFPTQISKTNRRRFMLKDFNRYLALSSDRRRFMDLDNTFNEALCLPGRTLICPTSSAILTEPASHCLFHLISGNLNIKEDANKCELTEIKTDDLYLQSIDVEEWAVSTPVPTSLKPICIDLNDTMTPTVSHPAIAIQGDVILSIPRQCTVTVGHHVIPTRMLMTEDMGQIATKIVTPSIHSHQLLELHGLQLINEKLDDEINHVFKDMIEYHHNKALTVNATAQEVRKLMKQMLEQAHEAEQIQPIMHYHAITWSTLVLIGIGLGILVWWVRRRPREQVRYEAKFTGGNRKGGSPKVMLARKKRQAPNRPESEETEEI